MTAQPTDPAPGPGTGSYEVIHLGGQAAVVVPVADSLRSYTLTAFLAGLTFSARAREGRRGLPVRVAGAAAGRACAAARLVTPGRARATAARGR